ncbi:hypothetical protein JL721_4677 [Aureococcus anophagefferens]|nr:hypothetical protein JL721_4677 [Aureococcus anophagefferens]
MAARPRHVVFWLLLCPARAFLGPPPPLRASPRPLRASPRPLRASPRPLRAAAADGAAGVAVRIEYCTGCRWMLRSAWLAQELLTTFDAGEIGEVGSARLWRAAASSPPSGGPTGETDLKSGLFGGDDDVAAKLAELERLTSLGRAGAVKLIERTNAAAGPRDPDDVDSL